MAQNINFKPAVKTVHQTILVVDDDISTRKLLKILLSEFGTVELAASGEEALQKANDLNPDMIILDVEMPGIDGYETCLRLKENRKTSDIPVIFLTAHDAIEDEEHGLGVGAIDFIRKPVSSKIMKSRASNILKTYDEKRNLKRLASTDPLTGAFNRRYFMSAGNSELVRCKRYKHTLTVLMLDIDHFKIVNDTYGHDIGDEALRQAVSTIQTNLRGGDTLGRLGGEEFAVILPETSKVRGYQFAERIRTAISEIVIDTPTDPLTFTISIGLSEGYEGDLDILDALKRADDALYQAKNHGRNRVV